ncbi:MAG: nicotinate phosphoribosyltransferase [Candidatus Glassbacteria bacterium]|nr:nicotinate phosphoribosyltransferase [Candidatus Glassbacteria bacterium]
MSGNSELTNLNEIAGGAAADSRRLFSADNSEIHSARVADVYLLKTRQILRAEHLDRTPVIADIHASADGLFIGGQEVRRLLDGKQVTVRALPEGERMAAGETVMQLEGPYDEFGIHETAILGILSSSSGWATAAAECVRAAGNKPVACFASRHLHPAAAPVMERAALIGGCSSASNILGAQLAGSQPVGTIPHALVLIVGDTLETAELYLKHLAGSGPLVCLVDTFRDEAEESVRVARALGRDLYGVRLDTPGELGGVTPELVARTREGLDGAGAGHVKIFCSGGMNPLRIPPLAAAGADAFGVGSYISAADPIDMTMDLKEISGKPIAKRGRTPGPAQNSRLVE